MESILQSSVFLTLSNDLVTSRSLSLSELRLMMADVLALEELKSHKRG
jgi:hypothetical protein